MYFCFELFQTYHMVNYYSRLIPEDDLPKTLFTLEFEDKDGKVYKQYVKEVILFNSLPNNKILDWYI